MGACEAYTRAPETVRYFSQSRKEHILWNLEKASKNYYLQESVQQQ